MDIKPGAEIENPSERTGVDDYRIKGVVKLSKMRKLSEDYAARSTAEKARSSTTALALRDMGENLGIDRYSINAITHVLNHLNLKLPAWRSNKNSKTVWYQLALGIEESKQQQSNIPDKDKLALVPFVFNLSSEFQKRMRGNNRSDTSALLTIISPVLKKALGRKVDMWLQIEMAPKAGSGKPHIQGAMLISDKEHKRTRLALHALNGEVNRGFKNRALRFCCKGRKAVANKHGFLYSDINWALYSAKETNRTKLFFVDQDKPSLTSVVAVTSGLRSKAAELYQSLC